MAVKTVSYAETIAIQAFLGYLSKNYSKSINAKDTFLIAAVSAWFHQESGGLGSVIGNNPFNIRKSPLQSGTRLSRNGNGHFAVFASMAKGWEAAAYLLMVGNKAYGYQIALNALKRGGNQAAVDFLAALAMSSWDAAHYGATDWLSAYNPRSNHILRNYLGVGGIQLRDPNPGSHPQSPGSPGSPSQSKPQPPKKPAPILPRDFNYQVVVRHYLNPWVARNRYATRHDHASLGTKVDGTTTKR